MQTAQVQRTCGGRNAFTSKPIKSRRVGGRAILQVQNAVKEVFMPALSSTMTEGKIVSWLKSIGDKVEKAQPIVVVESDKADMDVESFSEGILAAIVVNEGERANVGSPIAFVAESEADVDEAKKKAAAVGGAPAAAAPTAAAPEAAAPPPPPPAKVALHRLLHVNVAFDVVICILLEFRPPGRRNFLGKVMSRLHAYLG